MGSGSGVLLNLLAGIALLLWATRMVRIGVERALGDRLRDLIGRATASHAKSVGSGLITATALQSSTAAAVLLSSFAKRGLIGVSAGIAFMLGADVGSTLIVQALAFDLGQAVPVLLLTGVLLFLGPFGAVPKHVGRVLIGLALLILALGMVVAASHPLRDSALIAAVLSRMNDDVLLALVVGIGLTWLLHSSVAMMLFVITLASAGVVSLELAAWFVIAANIGAGLIPLGLSWRDGGAARRIMAGNAIARAVGALLALVALPWVLPWLAGLQAPGRALAHLHTGFNLAQAIIWLPFAPMLARLLEQWLPERPAGRARPLHLDTALLGQPSVAIGNASREVMRLADSVEVMLRDSLAALSEADDERHAEIRRLDDEVDQLQDDIKLYLSRLSRGSLSEAEARRCFDLIMFTTNLEHVGDIIDKGLIPLAMKKARASLAFSPEGWAEIVDLHARTVAHMRLAMTVFQTGDRDMARELVARKDAFRLAEAQAARAHVERLRAGEAATIETSTLHMDVLRDLKRIVSHLTSVAYPILEAAGELRTTRLEAIAEPVGGK